MAKINPGGSLAWAKRFGDGLDQEGSEAAVDPSGNVFVTGNFNGSLNFGSGSIVSAGGGNIFLTKLDPSGNGLWSKRFGDAPTHPTLPVPRRVTCSATNGSRPHSGGCSSPTTCGGSCTRRPTPTAHRSSSRPGLVRVPMDRPAPPNGRPVVTWAHGTTGTADTCSPSRRLDAPPVPDPFVNDGFVVAATDYTRASALPGPTRTSTAPAPVGRCSTS